MLKFPLQTIGLLLCITSFFNFTTSSSSTAKEEEKIIIKQKKQAIHFFLNDKNELNATLKVQITAVAQTKEKYTFSQTVFFDNNSTVDKIYKKVARRRKKVFPITSDYESDGIFHSDLKICYFKHDFTYQWEEVLFSYEKTFTDFKFFDPFYFNDLFLVKNSIVEIVIPDWLAMDLKEFNFGEGRIMKTNTQNEAKSIHTYIAQDLPNTFRFNNSPRRNKINAHIIMVPKSTTIKGKKESLFENVSHLYAWYASLVKDIGNDNQDLKKTVANLTAGKDDGLEKIKAIYYWVQDNIRYIAFENGIMGFRPESCQKVMQNKFGDCKGMANLTKEMLTLAGFDARLTWLGTNDLPYTYDLPSLMVDNHMICTVVYEGKNIFLDSTEKYTDIFNYAHRIQGKQVLIENGDKFIIENIPIIPPKENAEVIINEFSINATQQLEGKGKASYSGDRKASILYALSTNAEKDWEELIKNYLNNKDKNIKLSLETKPVLANRGNDFDVNYSMTIDNHIIDLGDELYVNVEMDYHFQGFEIPEDRNVPYEFSSNFLIDLTTTFQVPDGWAVDYVPERINFESKNHTITLAYEILEDKVVYHKYIEIKDTYLAVEDFKAWNEMTKKMSAFYGDQIILIKN